MTREYELKRRAQQLEATRQRIVEAAVELHQIVGPARTTVSAIAERAGVQRQTYYRHFPDDRSLRLACSGLYNERNPLPDPESWRAVAEPEQRLRHGLAELYAYYAANEPMLASVMRDAEYDPLTREMVTSSVAPVMAELLEALTERLQRDTSAAHLAGALALVLDFNTWRVLVRRSGLSEAEAVELGARIVRCLR